MKSPTDLLVGLMDDTKRLIPDVKGLNRDLITIKSRFEHEGGSFFTIALVQLGSALLKGLSTKEFTCPPGFKPIRRGRIPELFQGIFCKVFDPFSGILIDEPDLGAVKGLSEILFAFKKYPLASKNESKLDIEAKEGFQKNDEICRDVSIPCNIVDLLSRVVSYVLPGLRHEELVDPKYRHGPGAVVESLNANQKWSAVCKDLFNETFDTTSFGLSDFYAGVFSSLAIGSSDSQGVQQQASSGISKLISVPKNSTSRRTITIEPVLRQFLQQGLKSELWASLSHCPILSLSIDLFDQSLNQKLALEGSLNGKWATIDLKSASDLISLKLTDVIFRPFPHFYERMMMARSSMYTIQGQKCAPKQMHKYAGMGNATCFPVMSITIAVIAIAATLDARRIYNPTKEDIVRAARRIRTYGDDLIVESAYAHQVCDWLSKCGLIVNTKKSYLEGNFKESCGVDAFRGVDITPLYFQTEPDLSSNRREFAGELISFSNQAWLRGLFKTSDIVKTHVEQSLGRALPLTRVDSGALGWHTFRNFAQVQKWNSDLHRFEIYGDVIISRKRSDAIDGYPALLKFFCTPLIERSTGHLNKSIVRFRRKISRRWVTV